MGALSVRDVCLEKFDSGRDRLKSSGPETRWHFPDRRLLGTLIRALSSVLSLIPLGLGSIWILFNRDLAAWHDKVSETYACG